MRLNSKDKSGQSQKYLGRQCQPLPLIKSAIWSPAKRNIISSAAKHWSDMTPSTTSWISAHWPFLIMTMAVHSSHIWKTWRRTQFAKQKRNLHDGIAWRRRIVQCMHTPCDCNTLIRKCVTSATPATSILAFMTSNSISLAIRMSPPGLRGRHLLVFDLRRFIYLYVYYADFGAAAAAAADGKCAWIFQWDSRKRWRIVGGLIRCVYTLTAWLFRLATLTALRVYASASHLLNPE